MNKGELEDQLSDIDLSMKQYSLESYLFSNFRKKKSLNYDQTKKVVNKYCGLLIDQFNKLRDSYKEVYKRNKLAKLKAKSRKKDQKLPPRYLVDYDQFFESDSPSSDEDETSGTSHSLLKSKISGFLHIKPKTNTIVKEKFGKLSSKKLKAYSESENFNESILEELIEPRDTTCLSLSKQEIFEKVVKEFENVSSQLQKFWEVYCSFLRHNIEGTLDLLLYKNIKHYGRMLKMRRTRKIQQLLTRKLTNSDLKGFSK